MASASPQHAHSQIVIRTECLSTAGVPDRTRSVVVQSFTPDRLRLAAAVDVHFEVVAERKAEATTLDIAVSGHVGGELCFARPGRAAVGRATVVGIPEGDAYPQGPRSK